MVELNKDNDTVTWGENGCQEPAADYWARNIRLKAGIKGKYVSTGRICASSSTKNNSIIFSVTSELFVLVSSW